MSRFFVPALAALSLTACGGEASESVATQTPAAPAVTPAAATGDTSTETVADAPETQVDTSAILMGLGADYVDADLVNGRRQFRRCQSCHTTNEGGRHTVGPNISGLMNSAAASAEGYSYSSALTAAELTWDAATLDAWIANPRALVPGNRMSFVGLRDADDRRDIIAYIATETAQ
jgi:cytochrome c